MDTGSEAASGTTTGDRSIPPFTGSKRPMTSEADSLGSCYFGQYPKTSDRPEIQSKDANWRVISLPPTTSTTNGGRFLLVGSSAFDKYRLSDSYSGVKYVPMKLKKFAIPLGDQTYQIRDAKPVADSMTESSLTEILGLETTEQAQWVSGELFSGVDSPPKARRSIKSRKTLASSKSVGYFLKSKDGHTASPSFIENSTGAEISYFQTGTRKRPLTHGHGVVIRMTETDDETVVSQIKDDGSKMGGYATGGYVITYQTNEPVEQKRILLPIRSGVEVTSESVSRWMSKAEADKYDIYPVDVEDRG